MYTDNRIITPSTNRKTEHIHCTVAEDIVKSFIQLGKLVVTILYEIKVIEECSIIIIKVIKPFYFSNSIFHNS